MPTGTAVEKENLLMPSSSRVTPPPATPGRQVLNSLRAANCESKDGVGLAEWVPEFGTSMSWSARQLASFGRNTIGRRMDKEKIGGIPGGPLERQRFFDGISGGLEAGRAMLKRLGHQDFEERPDEFSPSVVDFFSRGENPQQIGRWIGRTNTLRADLPPEGGWADRQAESERPPQGGGVDQAASAQEAEPKLDPPAAENALASLDLPIPAPAARGKESGESMGADEFSPAPSMHTVRGIPDVMAAREHLRGMGHRRVNEDPQFSRSGRVMSVRLVTRGENPRQVGEWFPDGTMEIGSEVTPPQSQSTTTPSSLPSTSGAPDYAKRLLKRGYSGEEIASMSPATIQALAEGRLRAPGFIPEKHDFGASNECLTPSSERTTVSPGRQVLRDLRMANGSFGAAPPPPVGASNMPIDPSENLGGENFPGTDDFASLPSSQRASCMPGDANCSPGRRVLAELRQGKVLRQRLERAENALPVY